MGHRSSRRERGDRSPSRQKRRHRDKYKSPAGERSSSPARARAKSPANKEESSFWRRHSGKLAAAAGVAGLAAAVVASGGVGNALGKLASGARWLTDAAFGPSEAPRRNVYAQPETTDIVVTQPNAPETGAASVVLQGAPLKGAPPPPGGAKQPKAPPTGAPYVQMQSAYQSQRARGPPAGMPAHRPNSSSPARTSSPRGPSPLRMSKDAFRGAMARNMTSADTRPTSSPGEQERWEQRERQEQQEKREAEERRELRERQEIEQAERKYQEMIRTREFQEHEERQEQRVAKKRKEQEKNEDVERELRAMREVEEQVRAAKVTKKTGWLWGGQGGQGGQGPRRAQGKVSAKRKAAAAARSRSKAERQSRRLRSLQRGLGPRLGGGAGPRRSRVGAGARGTARDPRRLPRTHGNGGRARTGKTTRPKSGRARSGRRASAKARRRPAR